MKTIGAILLFVFISEIAFSQLSFTLVLSATPPANLSAWAGKKEVLTMVVNPGPGIRSFKVKTELKLSDGTVIGTTDLALARVITPSGTPGAVILYAEDVLPLDIMRFTGKYKTSLERTGKLPADNYQLCVQLVNPIDFQPLSAATCKMFYLSALQLPILMMPYDEQVLEKEKASTAIMFRWTPVNPRQSTAGVITYRLQVFEVLDHQQPVQALRSNQPLLDKMVTAQNQYIWRPQLSFIEPVREVDSSEVQSQKNLPNKSRPGHMFIWTIQSLNADGTPVEADSNGEGRSDPKVFFVGRKSTGQ